MSLPENVRNCAQIEAQVGTMVPTLTTERQARELSKVEPESRATDAAAPIVEWADLGKQLTHAGDAQLWALGDWSAKALAEQSDHNPVRAFCQVNGLDYGTVRNRAFVARAFPPERRRAKLSWGIHAEVAQLKPAEQDRWLDRVEREHLSLKALRQAIREAQGDESATISDGKPMKFASSHCDALADWLKTRPAGFWDDETRRTVWAERLRPLAKAFASLTGKAMP